MEFLSDPVLLARLQFAATAAYHFIFVPLTIGVGLIMAINATRAFRSRTPEDEAACVFWVKIFTATFVLGVATGITMEFSFGTNWADYSRFVGDIFGAPLAAEALLAFFLESSFLGVLLFGRGKVSPRMYCISAWLVWLGSALSALWILIANSWMQTPAGAELSADGSSAVLTDFLAAALNPSLSARYGHTVLALLVMGAFVAIAVSGWYMLKNKHADFAKKTMRLGAVVAVVSTVVLLGTAHSSAVIVSEEQPSKLAMMEGMYDSEVPPLYAFGWVDEESQEVITPFAIPGGTSFLATGTWDTEFPGLNELAQTEQFAGLDPETAPVNFVFQTYHLMVAMFGAICLVCLLVLLFTFRGGKIQHMRWLQWLCVISPVFPLLAIQAGWFTAEVGRQPWVVYPSMTSPDGVSLLVQDGVSVSVSNVEVVVTLILFLLVYLFLLVAWARVVGRFIAEGPVVKPAVAAADGDLAGMAFEEAVEVVEVASPAAGKADAPQEGRCAAEGGE